MKRWLLTLACIPLIPQDVGGLPRAEAETQAFACCAVEWLCIAVARDPPQSTPGVRCLSLLAGAGGACPGLLAARCGGRWRGLPALGLAAAARAALAWPD